VVSSTFKAEKDAQASVSKVYSLYCRSSDGLQSRQSPVGFIVEETIGEAPTR